jgi:hypothetical protein
MDPPMTIEITTCNISLYSPTGWARKFAPLPRLVLDAPLLWCKTFLFQGAGYGTQGAPPSEIQLGTSRQSSLPIPDRGDMNARILCCRVGESLRPVNHRAGNFVAANMFPVRL